jgi:WD40 repeat protein
VPAEEAVGVQHLVPQLVQSYTMSTKAGHRYPKPEQSSLLLSGSNALQVTTCQVVGSAPQDYEHLLLIPRVALWHVVRVVPVASKDASTAMATDEAAPTPTTHQIRHTSATFGNFGQAKVVAVDHYAVACGLSTGEVLVYPDLLLLYRDALRSSNKVKQPPRVLTRSLRWHAHPVSTLQFAQDRLYSAGREAVLAVWDLSRGSSYKPAWLLPRLALQSVTHLVLTPPAAGSGGGSILVAAADQTLQLYGLHNQSRQWKMQGWAGVGVGQSATQPKPWMMPSQAASSSRQQSSTLLVTGLPAAPGRLHVYQANGRQQEVQQSLEVVPFNRVSRTEPGEAPWTEPSVTLAAAAAQGLVTVDVTATENALGAAADDEEGGRLTTVRFWQLGGAVPDQQQHQQPLGNYHLTAVVAAPHGPTNKITAVALSPSGNLCCTISDDEGCFRVWQRHRPADSSTTTSAAGAKATSSSFAWAGRYKVTIPAGYANHATPREAVAFSSDDSLLAVAFGDTITLWDARTGSLLTSLPHMDDSPVESLQFLTTGRYLDLLLSFSGRGVVLQSPFGASGPLQLGWSWELDAIDKKHGKPTKYLSGALWLPTAEAIVLSQYNRKTRQTKFLLVDVASGRVRAQALWTKTRPVVALSAPSNDTTPSPSDAACFYAMTAVGNLFRVALPTSVDGTTVVSENEPLMGGFTTELPSTLVTPALYQAGNKRKRTAWVLAAPQTNARQTTRLVTDDDLAHLPRLRGAATRAFLGRHLQRK